MDNTEKSNVSNLSLSNELSEINNDESFNKDIERELKIGENNNKQPKSSTRKAMIINNHPQQLYFQNFLHLEIIKSRILISSKFSRLTSIYFF